MSGGLPDKPAAQSFTFWGLSILVLAAIADEAAKAGTWADLLTPAALAKILGSLAVALTGWGFRRKIGGTK